MNHPIIRCQFDFVHRLTTAEQLVIRDIGANCTSVTNDAEAVVDSLFRGGHLPAGRRLLYFDSGGDVDEILHDGHGRFAGFNPLRGAAPAEFFSEVAP